MWAIYYLVIGVLVILFKIFSDKYVFKRSFTADVKTLLISNGIPPRFALLIGLILCVILFPIIGVGMLFQYSQKKAKKK